MTPKEILEDFIVYTLLQYEELISPICYFFDQENAMSLFDGREKLNYVQYIREELKLPVFLELKKDLTVNPKRLSDLISKPQIEGLIKYLNEKFSQGFPDDVDEEGMAYGGNYSLNLTESELITSFNDYLYFHSINPGVYISFFLQLFYQKFNSVENQLKAETKRVDQLHRYRTNLPEELKEDYKNYHKEKFTRALFHSLEEEPYQYQGFFDDKGLYINDRSTLKKWLKISKQKKIKYDLQNIPSTGVSFLSYQYFQYEFFKFSFQEGSKENKEVLKNQFIALFKNNYSLVNYLKSKDFEEDEIKIILNFLTHNKYEDLGIRKIDFNQVEFFRLCYLFYIFDFFKEIKGIDFEEEKDFRNLHLENKPPNLKTRNNQYLKYYKNIRNKLSDYPFISIDKTENKIQKKLEIQKGKLKPIPEPDLF